MGNILIVAEKPAAGADIAKVVGATKRGSGYLEGNGYIVTWAVGHLIGLKKPEEHGEEYGKWQLGKLPLSFPLGDSLKVLPGTGKQFKIIKELIHRPDVDLLINAGDAGREGYLIQEWIYRMAGCTLPKKVLWASSLTTVGIQTALNNLKDNDLEEFRGILREAEARAEGDYFLGMNYSRLLTLTRAYGRQTLSYGRCQTPLHHADIFHSSLGFFFLLVSACFRFQKNAVVCFQLYAIGLFVNLAYCRSFLQFQFLRICCLAEFFDFCV